MKDFDKYLKWRFDLIDCDSGISIDEGIEVSIVLSNDQAIKLLGLESYEWENYKIRAKNYIANTKMIPMTMQPEGRYIFKGNQLMMSGSPLFIELMLEQLGLTVKQKSAQKF